MRLPVDPSRCRFHDGHGTMEWWAWKRRVPLVLILASSMWLYAPWFKSEASRLAMEFGGLRDSTKENRPVTIQECPSVQTPLVERHRRSNATLIYHIGWDTRFGRTNNQLLSILRALDKLFDDTGEWCEHGTNGTAVVAVSGWARATLRMFFAPEAQIEPYPERSVANGEAERNWTQQLEQHLPIVTYIRVKQAIPTDTEIVEVASDQAYYYTKSLEDSVDPVRLEHRRRLILPKLLRLVPESRFDRVSLLREYSKKKGLGEGFVVIHSRSLEGQCESRVGPALPPHECNMHAGYIKDLLRPHYGANLTRTSIVVITDSLSPHRLQNLLDDTEIGQNVIIPALEPWATALGTNKGRIYDVVDDMMLATMSDYFIGPRVSSMTLMIGMMRVAAMGADPQTNLVFVKERASIFGFLGPVQYTVCGHCIFHCDPTISDICGARYV